MSRKIWNEENVIKEVESMKLNFIEFVNFNKYKSRFIVQCSYGHEPYETNLNTLHKGRKAMGCPTCKSINKSQTNIDKVDFNYICNYIKQYNHTLLTTKEEYKGINNEIIIQCDICKKIENITFSAFKKRVNKCNDCINIQRYNNVLEKCKSINYILLDDKIEGYKSPINMMCDKGHIINPSYDSFIGKDCKCDECKSKSKGEERIEQFLKSINIFFHSHYRKLEVTYKRHLEFDFYIPQLNTIIEFDGIQHFKPTDYFGGFERFIDLKIKDGIKNEYCYFNKIRLIRIPYTQLNNIEEILIQQLNLDRYE